MLPERVQRQLGCAASHQADRESSTTMMPKILAILLVVGVFIYGWYRNDLRRLTRDFTCQQSFDGTLERCIVRFPVDETSTECVLGATSEGLYMSSSTDALQRNRRWSFRYHVIRTPLFIPWSRMQISDAKFPMRGYLRFSVPSNKANFFIPRETGGRFLQALEGQRHGADSALAVEGHRRP
jgi:hypothetical protein